jgi:hypothetical protein
MCFMKSQSLTSELYANAFYGLAVLWQLHSLDQWQCLLASQEQLCFPSAGNICSLQGSCLQLLAHFFFCSLGPCFLGAQLSCTILR